MQSIRRNPHRSLSESSYPASNHINEEEVSPNGSEDRSLTSIEPSERMHRDLDEASQMMVNMMESLDNDFNDAEDVVKRRSRTLSSKAMNRLGIVSTLSNSEPGKF